MIESAGARLEYLPVYSRSSISEDAFLKLKAIHKAAECSIDGF